MSRVGDVNGDGVSDFIVGSPYFANGQGVVGRAQVLSGIDGNLLYARVGADANAQFGYAVSGVGDTNGDGTPDFAVGARFANGLEASSGLVLVYSGADGAQLLSLPGSSSFDGFGSAIGRARDVNGDGFDDIIVGAPKSDLGLPDGGCIAVHSGFDGAQIYLLFGQSDGAEFGSSVAGIGDANDDGFDDFLVGAPFSEMNGVQVGQVHLFSGATGVVARSMSGEAFGDRFGATLANAGNVDRDGFHDFVVGAKGSDLGGLNAGRVQVFSGSTGLLLHDLVGGAIGQLMGTAVDGAGDVDRDGFDDIIVGAIGDGANGSLAGLATVHSGRDGATLETFLGTGPGAFLGQAVCGLGDVNGDGFFDVAMGAPGADVPAGNAGSIRVHVARTTPFFVYEDMPGTTRLYLEWTPNGGDPNSLLGTMSCSEATPGGLGQYAVSLSPASFLVFGTPVLIANDALNLIDSGTLGFGFSGEIAVPNISRVAPQLAGLFVFVQFFERMPFASSSNGVALLLTP